MGPSNNANELADVFETAVRGIVRSFVTIDGTIDDVDEVAYTCDIKVGDSIFFRVPLKVMIGTRASVIEIPVIGTDCLMSFRDGDQQRPQLLWVHDTKDLLINCENVIFNDGDLGGMVKVISLTERLNLIENRLNQHIDWAIGHLHTSGSEGSPTTTPTVTDPGDLTPTSREDIENPKIKQ